MLHENQKKYLAESNYLDGASRIDIKLYSGKIFSLSVEQFKDWVSSGKNPILNAVRQLRSVS